MWERGAKIIGVLHGDEAAVLLQTTRGNLECIYPRKLVLASIVNALAEQRFRDALYMVRRHRIDFNVIIDHSGWQTFVQYAPEFVKQVNNLNHLTEFICAIKKENVTERLYKNYIALPYTNKTKNEGARELKGFDPDNKVFSVFLAIRTAIQGKLPESPARELCILTTLARSDPPALEEALERVKVVREHQVELRTRLRKILFLSTGLRCRSIIKLGPQFASRSLRNWWYVDIVSHKLDCTHPHCVFLWVSSCCCDFVHYCPGGLI